MCPSFSTRTARAKLLLECGTYSDVVSLLESVLAADDTNIEGWYESSRPEVLRPTRFAVS
jgi:hypothetical protein